MFNLCITGLFLLLCASASADLHQQILNVYRKINFEHQPAFGTCSFIAKLNDTSGIKDDLVFCKRPSASCNAVFTHRIYEYESYEELYDTAKIILTRHRPTQFSKYAEIYKDKLQFVDDKIYNDITETFFTLIKKIPRYERVVKIYPHVGFRAFSWALLNCERINLRGFEVRPKIFCRQKCTAQESEVHFSMHATSFESIIYHALASSFPERIQMIPKIVYPVETFISQNYN